MNRWKLLSEVIASSLTIQSSEMLSNLQKADLRRVDI